MHIAKITRSYALHVFCLIFLCTSPESRLFSFSKMRSFSSRFYRNMKNVLHKSSNYMLGSIILSSVYSATIPNDPHRLHNLIIYAQDQHDPKEGYTENEIKNLKAYTQKQQKEILNLAYSLQQEGYTVTLLVEDSMERL